MKTLKYVEKSNYPNESNGNTTKMRSRYSVIAKEDKGGSS